MSDLYCDQVVTSRGVFQILFGAEGIYKILFPGASPDKQYPQRELPWSQLAEDLECYLAGQKVDWAKYPLDFSDYGTFTAALLKQVMHIPHGRVCTYREAAEMAGSPKAWRAAGQALKANRHPIIIPCHRVVGSGGKLGGFSGPEGWKEMLLNLEGALKDLNTTTGNFL